MLDKVDMKMPKPVAVLLNCAGAVSMKHPRAKGDSATVYVIIRL